ILSQRTRSALQIFFVALRPSHRATVLARTDALHAHAISVPMSRLQKISRKSSRGPRESEAASDHASVALSSSGKMRCIAGPRHAAGCTIVPAQTSPSVVVINTPFGNCIARRGRRGDGPA
ncbi:MAG TPA: hypothetical protein VJL90_03345, partial [Pseudorhodoplanes sp.]|nr:hypothetical protein [Pseudorhodoplanes sp.]